MTCILILSIQVPSSACIKVRVFIERETSWSWYQVIPGLFMVIQCSVSLHIRLITLSDFPSWEASHLEILTYFNVQGPFPKMQPPQKPPLYADRRTEPSDCHLDWSPFKDAWLLILKIFEVPIAYIFSGFPLLFCSRLNLRSTRLKVDTQNGLPGTFCILLSASDLALKSVHQALSIESGKFMKIHENS